MGGIALMARALPQAAAGVSGDPLAVPQLGLLAINDLQHLANSLLLLSQGYGAALEGATGEPVVPVLLSEALQLRAAARARMREQVGCGGARGVPG